MTDCVTRTSRGLTDPSVTRPRFEGRRLKAPLSLTVTAVILLSLAQVDATARISASDGSAPPPSAHDGFDNDAFNRPLGADHLVRNDEIFVPEAMGAKGQPQPEAETAAHGWAHADLPAPAAHAGTLDFDGFEHRLAMDRLDWSQKASPAASPSSEAAGPREVALTAHRWVRETRETAVAVEGLDFTGFERRFASYAAVSGNATAEAVALSAGRKAEIECLALNIYFEARSEPDLGKVAVAQVVMNRVASKRFPASICGVVRQGGEVKRHRCQFSWWCDGKSDRPRNRSAWQKSLELARDIYWGRSEDPTNGALWYHADYVSPYWRTAFDQGPKIGRHIFYTAKPKAPRTQLAESKKSD